MKIFKKCAKPDKNLALFLMTAFILFPQGNTSAETSTEIEVRVGYMSSFFSQVAQKDAEAALEIWVEKFLEGKDMNYEATGIVYEDVGAVEKAIRNNEVDIVSLSLLDFLSIRENPLFEPAFMASRDDSIQEELILLVQNDKGINGIHDLKSKTLKVLSGIHGQMATMWLDTLLMNEGLPECHEFFNTIVSVEKPSKAILPVFFGQTDACVVTRGSFSTAAELNPQIGRSLNVPTSSPGLVLFIMCFRKDFSARHKDEIRKYADKLHENPAGSQILMLFATKKMAAFDPELLKPAESLLNDYHRLKSLRKKPSGK